MVGPAPGGQAPRNITETPGPLPWDTRLPADSARCEGSCLSGLPSARRLVPSPGRRQLAGRKGQQRGNPGQTTVGQDIAQLSHFSGLLAPATNKSLKLVNRRLLKVLKV